MNLIKWIINKKQIEEQIEKDDREIDKLRNEIKKSKTYKEEVDSACERNDSLIESNLEQRKEIRKLKKENKFLMERENKLQLIETMFENEEVDLKKLTKIVKNK